MTDTCLTENPAAGETRKIFFLFFSSDTGRELIKKIFSYEYEVYSIDAVEPYLGIIRTNPNSILIANNDNVPRNCDWRSHFIDLSGSFSEKGMLISSWYRNGNMISIDPKLSNYQPPVMQLEYRNWHLTAGEQLLQMLKNLQARGRRTFLRISPDSSQPVSFSIKVNKTVFSGKILDLSSVAIACIFNGDLDLPENMQIEDIQLRLGVHIASASGHIFKKRSLKDMSVYVIALNVKRHPDTRAKIMNYIYFYLQQNLKSLAGITDR